MNFAPVVLFVYKRLIHTTKTLITLKNNMYAEDTDLIIYSDGAKDDSTKIEVNKVREYIKTISGFKSIKIIENEKNIGLANSIITGVTETVQKYGKLIVVEDDLVTSPFFLKYMNEALDYYENEDKVISIHGYIYPVKNKLPETFFLKGADCWGWATWKRGWDLFESDGVKLLKELEDKNLTYDFDFYGKTGYTLMLKNQINGNNDSWAIRWYASAFLNNKLTLYPGKSLVYNIGTDNSGTHSGETDNYKVILSKKEINIEKIPVSENLESKKIISGFFSQKNYKKNVIPILIKIGINLLPPIFVKIIKKIKKNEFINNILDYGWFGPYESWDDAKKESSGYDSDKILEKVKNSLIKVKNGEAVYERDSYLFDKIEYSFPVLSGLLWIATKNKNRLNIIDFGGSLGSSYFQNLNFIKHLDYSWNIVEQNNFIETGKKYFENDKLKFYPNIESCIKEIKIDVILFSSVIQYIEKPYELLNDLMKYNLNYIIFDLSGFINNDIDIITLQKVNPNIYEARYPCWFFNEKKFINFFTENNYRLIVDFENFIKININNDFDKTGNYKGFIFVNNKVI